MQLLTSPTTPFGRTCRIVIAFHKLEVKEVPVKIWVEREKVEGKNPLSQIPVLLLDDGTAIVDSRVITEHLDSLGGNPLLPADPDKRLRMRSDCAIWHAVASGAAACFSPKAMLDAPLPEKVLEWNLDKIKAVLSQTDTQAGSGAYDPQAPLDLLHVHAVSALGMVELRISDLIDWRSDYPKLAAWHDAMHERHEAIAATAPPAG